MHQHNEQIIGPCGGRRGSARSGGFLQSILTAGLEMDRNCWWQPSGALMVWLKDTYGADRFADYQAKTRKDAHSIVADPRFADAAKRDFRPAAGGDFGATEPQREE